MTRRSANIVLHWSVFLLLLAMIKGGTSAEVLRWVYVALGGLWVTLAVLRGPLARPGPKLQGVLRDSFRPAHMGIYALVALSVILNALALLGAAPLLWAWNSLLVLLVVATFHALFHFWRHTALNDGALRMIIPKRWHWIL